MGSEQLIIIAFSLRQSQRHVRPDETHQADISCLRHHGATSTSLYSYCHRYMFPLIPLKSIHNIRQTLSSASAYPPTEQSEKYIKYKANMMQTMPNTHNRRGFFFFYSFCGDTPIGHAELGNRIPNQYIIPLGINRQKKEEKKNNFQTFIIFAFRLSQRSFRSTLAKSKIVCSVQKH